MQRKVPELSVYVDAFPFPRELVFEHPWRAAGDEAALAYRPGAKRRPHSVRKRTRPTAQRRSARPPPPRTCASTLKVEDPFRR